jgi:hypothetical protein
MGKLDTEETKQIGKMDKQILINLCQNHAGIAEVEIIF